MPMPIFNFVCEGGHRLQVLRPAAPKAEELEACKICGNHWRRESRGPSVRIVETRDNGIMPRVVERLQDIKEIMTERRQHDKDKGCSN